jgi:25S rRNA (uracil2634-N3)-methyltransferase
VIGEGNFSFARCLCDILGGDRIIASCYDSLETLTTKYPDAPTNIEGILELSGTVLYNVDATELSGSKKLKGKKFDRVVFNFPHVGLGIKDLGRNVEKNQELCRGFFESAMGVLKEDGQIVS